MVRSFEDLGIWKKAHSLFIDIDKITRNFPPEEKYILKSQLRRAALSVEANIAEGFGRFHYKDNIMFLIRSRGSLDETRSHLISAKDLEYINNNQFQFLNEEFIGLKKGINSLISKLRKI